MISLIYETFNPEIHDVSRVARLVYDVDFRTFDMLFSKENAIKAISSDLRKRKITPNLKVVLDDGEIIGMLKVETSHKAHDFRVKSLRLAVVDVLDYFVLCDINDDDFYIAEIAVDEPVFEELLHLFDCCIRSGFPPCWNERITILNN